MSLHTISQYYTEVDRVYQYGGNRKETAIRTSFYNLLNNSYAQPKDLILIQELDYRLPTGKIVYPDGTLKDALRLDWGYWESKDTSDDLNREIEKKFAAGYPNSNILFEDSQTAVLFQDGEEVGRCKVRDPEALDKLLTRFVSFTRPEVKGFRHALDSFKADVPQIAATLREMIDKQNQTNQAFKRAQLEFLTLCKESINADVTSDDVNEMLIQHILTEDIFTTVFDDPTFHQENNISKELHKLESTFFTGNTKRTTLDSIKPYYSVIKTEASRIANHTEKQRFLKVMYENFYKAYNPKAADRLGIVYTPDEIVKFMLESTDYLLYKHFGKILASDGVEILDPATGTGTFITDLIDYLPADKLAHKYKNEIHCNEVAILPYYIANLNIEATFKQKMGYYEEFPNICFMDTLDNMAFNFAGNQTSLFGSMSAENAERVKAQNARKISVVIGNPPYNANQQNENDNNKNREYFGDRKKKIGGVDGRIRETFIAQSTAQKTKVYDMYARFYRWAMDRLDKNGVIAFITNRSFIDSRTFDGFRKCIQDDFAYAYIIDTKSDVRANPKISGTKNNVFGIQAGVAIMFLVKQPKVPGEKCQIRYVSMSDEWTRKEKLVWFEEHLMKEIGFELITPDVKGNWLGLSESNFESLLSVIERDGKSGRQLKVLFKLYSLGVKSNRDEWVCDIRQSTLSEKIIYLIESYNNQLKDFDFQQLTSKPLESLINYNIKWTRKLKRLFINKKNLKFESNKVVKSLYRPFSANFTYISDELIEDPYQIHQIFSKENIVIALSGLPSMKPFQVIATDKPFHHDFLEKTQCLPLYRYDAKGNRLNNITDWGLQQFQTHNQDDSISKESIFYYTYSVLHHPAYRTKYELNLKREFPRLPFYANFWQWVAWGKALMDLHINYETVTPYALERKDAKPAVQPQQPVLFTLPAAKGQLAPTTTLFDQKQVKARLKADKLTGQIEIDDVTTLTGIPAVAWQYKLGNRSALEWVLDQYKEKKPSDPTIAAKFNTYRFADYKEHVIDLLQRVCTVSVETMAIIGKMPDEV